MKLVKIHEINSMQFYQLPKELFTNPSYKDMSITAKVLYSILRDRMELSRINNWVNGKGEIYLIFAQTELQGLLNISENTLRNVIHELEKYKLIQREKTSGKVDKIFIAHIDIQTPPQTANTPPQTLGGVPPQKLSPNDTELSETELSDLKDIKDCASAPPKKEISLHRKTTDRFCERFKTEYGYPYDFTSKDGKLISDLTKKYGHEFVMALVDWFFDTEDDFTKKTGRTIGVMKTFVTKYIIQKSNSRNNFDDILTGEELE